MNWTNVLLKPLLTEKATFLKETVNQVVFMVDPRANKVEIAAAVEKAFSVKVREVAVIRRRPRAKKRQGKVVCQFSGWKKAYVSLEAGAKIELFEGV